MEKILSVKGLSYKYPRKEKPALENFSFDVNRGDYISILGANGSGKSTLARCLAGLYKGQSGTITRNNDEPVFEALMFQDSSDQIVSDTAIRDSAFGPENIGMDRTKMVETVLKNLEAVSLLKEAESPVGGFSPGMKQRLVLAGVLSLESSVLILDEITSMIDPAGRKEILQILKTLNLRGKTVISVTHDLEEAKEGNRVIVVNDGKKTFDGKPEDLFTKENELFLKESHLWFSMPEKIPFAGIKDGESQKEKYALEFRNVSYTYKENNLKALDNLSLKIHQGSITALVGETGSGKTTFMELAGFLKLPDEGTIHSLGENPLESNKALSHYRLRSPLCIQEGSASVFAQVVGDEVAFGPMNQGLKGKRLLQAVKQGMEIAGLDYKEFRDRPCALLSGGELRKTGLAGILAMDSPVYFFDEPTCALDPEGRENILKVFNKLKSMGKTVVFTTHRTEEKEFADFVIDFGKKKEVANHKEIPAKDKEKAHPTQEIIKKQRKKILKKNPEIKQLEKLSETLIPQVYRKESFVTSLHPLTKYIMLIAGLASVLISPGIIQTAGIMAVFSLIYLLAKLPVKTAVKSILLVLPGIILIALIQSLLYIPSKNEEPALILFNYQIYQGSLEQSVILIMRFIAMYLAINIFSSVTNIPQMVYGMDLLLKPLKPFKIQSQYGGLMMMAVFRFLPVLKEEMLKILKTQLSRGFVLKHKHSFTMFTSMAVPVIVRTLKKADRFSETVEARYFGTKPARTYLDKFEWHKKDSVFLCIFIFLTIIAPVVSGFFLNK